MSFKKRIDKILNNSNLGVNSINALEKKIGASTGAVNKYYKKDEFPGTATIKKIKKGFDFSDREWDQLGEDLEPVNLEKLLPGTRLIDMEAWQELKRSNERHDQANEFIRGENEFLRTEIEFLRSLIKNPASINPHKA